MVEEVNPYLAMPNETFKTHIVQIVEAMEKQKMTKLQAFGESLSDETQDKVTQHASLTEQVKTLESAAATADVGKISPETLKLAKLSTERSISDIKLIDEHFPIAGILDNSSLDEFQKIDMLSVAKVGAEYTQKAVNAIKEHVGSNTDTKLQGFSAPDENTDIDNLVDGLITKSGMKVQ